MRRRPGVAGASGRPGGRWCALALSLGLALLAAGPATAAEDAAGERGARRPMPEAERAGSGFGYDLAHELMSPYCPGRTLAACPSEQAAEVRQWILLQEAAGASREEVVAALEARFGDIIQSSPDAEGWGLAAWLLPVAALVGGALLVLLVLRRMVGSGDSARSSADAADAAAGVGRAGPASGPRAVDTDGARPRASSEDAELERLVDAELAAGER